MNNCIELSNLSKIFFDTKKNVKVLKKNKFLNLNWEKYIL